MNPTTRLYVSAVGASLAVAGMWIGGNAGIGVSLASIAINLVAIFAPPSA